MPTSGVQKYRAGGRIEGLWQDVRYGLRQLGRSPGFSGLTILTLAVGIGANTAVFSFVNSVLLRPLPYPNADRLAIIWSGLGYSNRAPASGFELFQIRQRTNQFDEVGGIWVTNGALPGDGDAEQVKVGAVTSNFLRLLCTKPALGRLLSSEDETSDSARAIVISHAVWVRRFGADPAIIGRSVRYGTGSAVVVGVLPQTFRLIFPGDASVPSHVDVFYAIPVNSSNPQGPAFLHLIGRLRSGTNLASAQAEADVISRQINSLDGRLAMSNFRLYIFSLQADDVRDVRSTLLLLFGGVAFVLLIGCANVANLMMERARRRRRETTIRAALGASRGRLLRQFLTESLLLGCFGGAGALAIGWAAVRLILSTRPPSFTSFGEVDLDLRVLCFTFVVTILTSAVFGFAPVMALSSLELAGSLKEAGRLSGWRKRHRVDPLVATEVALAFVLLVGSGLLMRTFVNVLRVQPGFRTENVFTLRISAPTYNMLRQIQHNLANLPGVRSVAAVSHLPLDDTGNWYDYYWQEGARFELQNTVMADHRAILPGYFNTIGASLLKGRDFTESDDASHGHVTIVDDILARQLWPSGDAIGKQLNVSDSPSGFYQFQRDWVVVVGVVRHIQDHSLTAIVRPQIYLPYRLAPRPTMSIVMHTAGALPNLAASARKQVALVSRDIPVSGLAPFSQVVARALSESRFASLLATLLSTIALLLACIGTYGVLSYSVAQRTGEIGIRMAIGARRGQVLRMVLAEGFASVLAGLTAGFLFSLVLTPLLARLLFGVKPGDPGNYSIILMLMLLVSAMATLIPARRAMKIDPLKALKYE